MAMRVPGTRCLGVLVRPSTRPVHRIPYCGRRPAAAVAAPALSYRNFCVGGGVKGGVGGSGPRRNAHTASGLQNDTASWQKKQPWDARPPRPKSAMFFPGQGVQRVNMVTHWSSLYPATVAPLIELLDHTIAASDAKFPPDPRDATTSRFSEIMRYGPAPLLTATPNAQPAILFASLCFLAVLEKDYGLDVAKYVDYFLGHSLGEFSALVAAGILSLEDAITLVRRRGIAMAGAVPEDERDDVGMWALITPKEHLPELIKDINRIIKESEGIIPEGKLVQIANHNTSSQIVVSGHISAIKPLLYHIRTFSGHDPRALKLNVSAPFHSPLMAPAAGVVSDILSEIVLNWEGRKGEVVGNVTGRIYTSEKELRELLAAQAVEKVRWAESIRCLEDEEGVEHWVGFGPEMRVGRGLVKRDIKGKIMMVGEGVPARDMENVVRFLENSLPEPSPVKEFGAATTTV